MFESGMGKAQVLTSEYPNQYMLPSLTSKVGHQNPTKPDPVYTPAYKTHQPKNTIPVVQ
jgi:hypothetical protein